MFSKLMPIFRAYENLCLEADKLFAKISNQYSDCVSCKPGCSDCCFALFDLPLIEAMYLNYTFFQTFRDDKLRKEVLERALTTEKELTKLKRTFFKQEQNGTEFAQILANVSSHKSRCPLLDDQQHCLLYKARPITCRLYGVPTAINGKGHVCGLAKFNKGQDYPTVFIDKIQIQLDAMSYAIQNALNSKFSALHDVWVPVAMALSTTYNAQYLGVENN